MRKVYLVVVGVMVLTFGLGGALAAQSGEPPRLDAPQANLGTAITYQGQLRKANGPVNGNCDMAFRLFDAVTSGAPIGTPITTTVPVTNGLFTVGLDFGAEAFNGEARWLEIGVKCASDAAFTALTPRQAITSAPYALALPGLRTMQNAGSPNVIGGYAGNVISDTVEGGTIGGGGRSGEINRITDDYATIGGGRDNTASGVYSTVGGGLANTANSGASTIGGGWNNTANGNYSTVGGGRSNTASEYSTIGGGDRNVANGAWSTIGGGEVNAANGVFSTISGGVGNTASGHVSTVPGGAGALASHIGEMAYASGSFASIGDAQTSIYVLRATVPSNQTAGELFLDGSGARLTITNTRTLAFDILIVARSDNGKSSGWRYQGVIENEGGATRFIGTPTKTILGEDNITWDVDLLADDVNDALIIKGFSNTSGDRIRFVATVRTVEVAF